MAATITVEEERGTYTRNPRRHNGYYAGDFSQYVETRASRAFRRVDRALDRPHS